MTQIAKPTPTLATVRHWATAACLVAGTLLSSCGGQSSGSGSTNPPTVGGTPTSTPDAGTPPTSGSTSILAIAGAYQGAALGNSSEFVSFVTPDQQFFALYALQTGASDVYPIIYTGSIHIASAVSASAVGLKSFQSPNNLRSGSATVTGTSAAAHTLALSNLYIQTLNASPQFSVASTATNANIQGNWVGTWADALDGSIKTSANLEFEPIGATFTAQTGFGNCTSMALTLTPATDAPSTPYFIAQLDIEARNACLRNPAPSYAPTTLRGVAFIHLNSAGRKRLELIITNPNGTDTSGSGISFRGVQ